MESMESVTSIYWVERDGFWNCAKYHADSPHDNTSGDVPSQLGWFALCCGNSRQNSLLSNLYSPSCALDNTVTILAGAERIIRGSRRQVNRKWPRWFTPNWVYNPSTVLLWGNPKIPGTINPHDSSIDNVCHFRPGTQFGAADIWCRVRLVFLKMSNRPSMVLLL
jgi:hypothetical protein